MLLERMLLNRNDIWLRRLSLEGQLRLLRRQDRGRRRRDLQIFRRFCCDRRNVDLRGQLLLQLAILCETVSILEAEADIVEHGELLVVAEIEAGYHAVVWDGEEGEILARVHLEQLFLPHHDSPGSKIFIIALFRFNSTTVLQDPLRSCYFIFVELGEFTSQPLSIFTFHSRQSGLHFCKSPMKLHQSFFVLFHHPIHAL